MILLLGTYQSRRVVVAIDGPAGAGKSTIARRLAERLGFTYIDTGAMYRAVALWGLRQKAAADDHHRMEQLALAAEIELAPGRIQLNGEDVTEAIRTAEVSSGASRIAVIPGVRRAMVAKQREIGQRTSVVMEGRDIGTVVFPDADVKIFLDAGRRSACAAASARMRAKGAAVSEVRGRADGGARPARQHPRRRAAGPGARRRLPGFHRPGDGRGGRGDPENGARARHQRKGIQLNDSNLFGRASAAAAWRFCLAERTAP